jgi:hypothetical protein
MEQETRMGAYGHPPRCVGPQPQVPGVARHVKEVGTGQGTLMGVEAQSACGVKPRLQTKHGFRLTFRVVVT